MRELQLVFPEFAVRCRIFHGPRETHVHALIARPSQLNATADDALNEACLADS